ncbi:MAG: gliding motility lipoprotein GldD [Bacteroidetes bacterium]|nr:MAG: gliding motility lipoprotein GldD [Bacteroidota bacterium]
MFRGLVGLSLCLGLCGLLVGCSNPPVPKPEGYPRFDFPEKEYGPSDTKLPYSFDMPLYAELEHRPDGSGTNIVVPQYKATIYLSYYDKPGALDTLFEDAHTMAYKHSVKADAIEEKVFENPQDSVYAMLYRIKGNVASSVQFYATDSVRRFLRGALYFYSEPNIDSLAPAVRFFEADILRMIETLKWREEAWPRSEK